MPFTIHDMRLIVTEIFHSLQGEGPFIGLPSVFVRLGGCIEPLCPWCDTRYAWHEFEEMGNGEIMAAIRRHACRNVVVTGGEPFLQWVSGLENLHDELAGEGYRIYYETSGKVEIPSLGDAAVIMSPKHIEGEWHIAAGNLTRAQYFKFVADDEESLQAIDRFVKDNGLAREQVYIMPMGVTRREQCERMELIFSFCRDKGYWMTPRLHVLIFDDRRGV